MQITILWHIKHEFYNVRIPKGLKTISASAMHMRHKIYHVDNVNWKFHVVLTLSPESVEKNKIINSGILKTYLNKLKKTFPKRKYFWKYEEGRESERPHFHLLLDLNEEIGKKVKEIRKIIDVKNLDTYVKKQKEYELNKNKTSKEIVMGYFMHKIWGKGIVHVRSIKNPLELIEQVDKDICKETGTKGFEEKRRKYGFSKGMSVSKGKGSGEYEWKGNVDNVKEAMLYLEETKDNFVSHFTEKWEGTLDGNLIYERTVNNLLDYGKEQEKKKVQVPLF